MTGIVVFASRPKTASTAAACGVGGPIFAYTLSVIVVLGVATQVLGVERGSRRSRAVLRWPAPNVIVLALLRAGGLVEGEDRVVLRLLGAAVTRGAMIGAGSGESIGSSVPGR